MWSGHLLVIWFILIWPQPWYNPLRLTGQQQTISTHRRLDSQMLTKRYWRLCDGLSSVALYPLLLFTLKKLEHRQNTRYARSSIKVIFFSIEYMDRFYACEGTLSPSGLLLSAHLRKKGVFYLLLKMFYYLIRKYLEEYFWRLFQKSMKFWRGKKGFLGKLTVF